VEVAATFCSFEYQLVGDLSIMKTKVEVSFLVISSPA